jgi:predicted transcriptional regulator
MFAAAVAGLGLALAAWAQTPPATQPAPKDAAELSERCKLAAQRMEQAQARMREMNQELKSRLDAMDKAQGQARTDAMEQAIRTLIGQRLEMDERRAEMMRGMAEHMGQHMMMGPDGCRMMAKCPMMMCCAPATRPVTGPAAAPPHDHSGHAH